MVLFVPSLVGVLCGAAFASLPSSLSVAVAQAKQNPQASVISDGKQHAGYITIYLSANADIRKAARVVAGIQRIVDEVVPPEDRDDDNEILAGVGFGVRVTRALQLAAPEDFDYHTRNGGLGSMPATGGDFFVHVKSDVLDNCIRVARRLHSELSPLGIQLFDDRYGYVHRNGRDLSGFIDGTANVVGEDDRRRVCLQPSGGSYVITQRWVHDFAGIAAMKVSEQEAAVGRSKPDSIRLEPLPTGSHVARMLGNHKSGEKIEIYRQSMPYGPVNGESGLFFIAYARSPSHFNYMLDRMTGQTSDKLNDNIMRMTKCVSGAYWYVPGNEELARIAH